MEGANLATKLFKGDETVLDATESGIGVENCEGILRPYIALKVGPGLVVQATLTSEQCQGMYKALQLALLDTQATKSAQ